MLRYTSFVVVALVSLIAVGCSDSKPVPMTVSFTKTASTCTPAQVETFNCEGQLVKGEDGYKRWMVACAPNAPTTGPITPIAAPTPVK